MRRQHHEVRDRASYALALISVATVVQADGSGRMAFGGVAHRPWRVPAAEEALLRGGKLVTDQLLAGPALVVDQVTGEHSVVHIERQR